MALKLTGNSLSARFVEYWLAQGMAIVIRGQYFNGVYRNSVSYERLG